MKKSCYLPFTVAAFAVGIWLIDSLPTGVSREQQPHWSRHRLWSAVWESDSGSGPATSETEAESSNYSGSAAMNSTAGREL